MSSAPPRRRPPSTAHLLETIRALLGAPPPRPAGAGRFSRCADLATLAALQFEAGDLASAVATIAELREADPARRAAWEALGLALVVGAA